MRNQAFYLGIFLWAGWIGLPGAWADTVFFKDGTSIDCLVSEEKKKFTEEEYQDPDFIEIEIFGGYVGFWNRGQVDRIEKNDNYVPPEDETQAFMRELIQKNQLILPAAMMEGGFVLPGEVEQPITGKVIQVKNWGFLSESGLAQKMRIEQGREFKANQTVSTARNSRLKFSVGALVTGGLGGGTTLQVQRLNHAEHLSTYELQLRLERGQLWIKINRTVLSGGVLEKVKLQLNDCDLVADEGLLHCQVQPGQQLRLTLFEGKGIKVLVKGNPAAAQLEPGETLVVPLQGEKVLTMEAAAPAAAAAWAAWDSWQAAEVVVPVKAIPGEPLSAPILGELSAFAEGRGRLESGLTADLATDALPTIMAKYRVALESYKQKNGQYPDPAEGLAILHQDSPEGEQGDPYNVRDLPLKDPWGSPITYDVLKAQVEEATASYVSIRSFGPNRIDEKGLGDDIQ